jgi:uncharacterized protein (TIGR02246 family)
MMKLKQPLLVAAILTLGLTPLAYADPAADEAALKARASEFAAAWDKDDAHGMAAVFAPEGDIINPFGRVAKGRAEVEKLFADEHGGFAKATHYNLLSMTTRLFGDAAVQDWDVEVTGMKGTDGSAMPPLKHHVTVTYTKKGGKWWAVAVRPVVYAPAPGGPPQ